MRIFFIIQHKLKNNKINDTFFLDIITSYQNNSKHDIDFAFHCFNSQLRKIFDFNPDLIVFFSDPYNRWKIKKFKHSIFSSFFKNIKTFNCPFLSNRHDIELIDLFKKYNIDIKFQIFDNLGEKLQKVFKKNTYEIDSSFHQIIDISQDFFDIQWNHNTSL